MSYAYDNNFGGRTPSVDHLVSQRMGGVLGGGGYSENPWGGYPDYPQAPQMPEMKGPSWLMKMMQSPLFAIGGSLVSNVLGSLFGSDPYKDVRRNAVKGMQQQLGTDVLNVPEMIRQMDLYNALNQDEIEEGINRRLNLDTGAAQSERLKQRYQTVNKFALEAGARNQQLMSDRDLRIRQFLAGVR